MDDDFDPHTTRPPRDCTDGSAGYAEMRQSAKNTSSDELGWQLQLVQYALQNGATSETIRQVLGDQLAYVVTAQPEHQKAIVCSTSTGANLDSSQATQPAISPSTDPANPVNLLKPLGKLSSGKKNPAAVSSDSASVGAKGALHQAPRS